MRTTAIPTHLGYLPTDLELLEAVCWADSEADATEALQALDRILPRLSTPQKLQGLSQAHAHHRVTMELLRELLLQGSAPSSRSSDRQSPWALATTLFRSCGMRWDELRRSGGAQEIENLLGTVYGLRLTAGKAETLRALESYGAGWHGT